jgi:hypothetical protein
VKLKAYLAKGKEAPPKGPTSKETTWMFVERLVVSTGKLWIGDPRMSWAECRNDEGCTLKLPNGTYVVEAKAQEFGAPRLVTRLRAYLDEAEDLKPGKEIGEAGTDSGQMGVCDPKLLMAAFAAAFENDEDQILDSLESAFDDHCGIYRPKPKTDGCIVYVPSGFGDGGGPVLELRSGRRTVGFETKFIATEES